MIIYISHYALRSALLQIWVKKMNINFATLIFIICSILSLDSCAQKAENSLKESQTSNLNAALSSEQYSNGIDKLTKSLEQGDTIVVHSQIRTATGGLINTIMIMLTVFAFFGNALFLIYVFWLSK